MHSFTTQSTLIAMFGSEKPLKKRFLDERIWIFLSASWEIGSSLRIDENAFSFQFGT
jgi:hypothetical protein